MSIHTVDAATLDDETAAALVAVRNATAAVDAPHLTAISAEHLRLQMRHGWEGTPPERLFVATAGDDVVAMAEMDLETWDNKHLAWIGIDVHPDHRAGSYADELLACAMDAARAAGKSLILGTAWSHTDEVKFWLRHGFEIASRGAQRRLVVADLDWSTLDKLLDESQEASPAYDIEVMPTPVPDDQMGRMLELQRAMNDAPIDGLAIEDEEWSVERFRGRERAAADRHVKEHRLVARRRDDGELGGHTVVAVEDERPQLGFQEDTAVVRGHRGHKLGLRLKIEMLRLLRDEEPQIVTIDTWNAESNDHMLAVNDALGCVVVGREIEFQLNLDH